MTGRDRNVLMGFVAIVIVGAIWLLVIGPRHKQYSAASDQLATAQEELATAQQNLKVAQDAKRNYAGDYSQIAQLGKAVPANDEVSSLVYQLDTAADKNDIDFRSIKLNSSGAAAAPAPAAPAPSGTSTTSTTSTTPTTATPAAGATAAPTNTAAATLPPGAAIGEAGFPTMPFDFVFDGSFFDMSAFLRQLDNFTTVDDKTLAVRGRLLTINGISIQASRDGFPKIAASVNATAFLLPPGEGLTAGATAQAPAASPTAATGASGASSSPTPAAAATR